jgi:DNA-binding SARP family transcriptional activator
MQVLRIFTLGGLRILRGETPIDLRETRKAVALLIYLASTSRSQPREVLADLFWDERSQKQAQSNLRVALASLRKHLGEYLVIDRENIALNQEAPIWMDSKEMEEGLRIFRANGEVRSVQEADRVEQAVGLYQGEFLAGFFVRESQGFEDWMLHEQERLQRMVADALQALVEFNIGMGTYQAGLANAVRHLNLDPLAETAHRQMMELLARSGRRGEALAQYEYLKCLLREELAISPAKATLDIYQKIISGEFEIPGNAAGLIRGYEIQEKIGEGSFGIVYVAYQLAVGRVVAIKVILPQYANDPEFIRRFETEAQIVARLEHPCIVPLYDYWRDPDRAYLVMRWLQGGSLADELRRGPLTTERVAKVIDQVAAALNAAHRQGIIHRDLKPENILLDEMGNVYLSDFGVAKDLKVEGRNTAPGTFKGSPEYMSPEQILIQPLGAQADIYSLGILSYKLLTGKLPFQKAPLTSLIDKQLHELLPSVRTRCPELSPAVDEVLWRATAKDPRERCGDILAFAASFREALGGALPPGSGNSSSRVAMS